MPALLASLWLVCLLVSPWVLAEDSPQDELKAVRGRIEALEKRIQDQEQARQETAQAVKSSTLEMQDARRRLKEIRSRAKVLQGQLDELTLQRATLDKTLATQRESLSRLAYRQYLGGAPQSLQLMLSGKDAGQVSRELHYLTYVSKSRGQVIADLRQNRAQLEQVSVQTEEKKKEIETLVQQTQSEEKRLQSELKQREGNLSKASGELQRSREEIEALKKNEKTLATLVSHLAREKARKNKKKREKEGKGAAVPDPLSDGVFARLKGKLRLPVIGDVTHRFGTARSDTGLSWKGIIIAAAPGEAVKAVAEGQVAYADTLRGFGKLMILDHGDGYMSLYGNNRSLSRKVGEKVEAGERIATLGSSDGGGESGLYFEIRVQGKPVDPMKWMAR